jgi:hypothetical protein
MNKSQKTEVAVKFLDKCMNDYYKSLHKRTSPLKLGVILKNNLINALNELDADVSTTSSEK